MYFCLYKPDNMLYWYVFLGKTIFFDRLKCWLWLYFDFTSPSSRKMCLWCIKGQKCQKEDKTCKKLLSYNFQRYSFQLQIIFVFPRNRKFPVFCLIFDNMGNNRFKHKKDLCPNWSILTRYKSVICPNRSILSRCKKYNFQYENKKQWKFFCFHDTEYTECYDIF